MRGFLKILFGFGLFLLLIIFVEAQNSQVELSVQGQGLIIGTPNNLNIGSVSEGDTIESSFVDYFWIEDLRGISTGHYTTIQCDGLYGPSDSIITGVQLSGAIVDRIAGTANNTLIYSSLSSRTDITEPKLYLYRNDIVGTNGLINRYGNKPAIKITVPSGVPAGSYKGKITYTLYDMGFNY